MAEEDDLQGMGIGESGACEEPQIGKDVGIKEMGFIDKKDCGQV